MGSVVGLCNSLLACSEDVVDSFNVWQAIVDDDDEIAYFTVR